MQPEGRRESRTPGRGLDAGGGRRDIGLCLDFARAGVGLDHAVPEPHDAAGVEGHFILVGDEDDRLSVGVQPVEQRENFLRRHRIEIPGRLVGEDVARVVDEAARDARPLLLAAGKLKRPVLQPIAEPDEFRELAAPLPPLRRDVALIVQRRLDVLDDGELRDRGCSFEKRSRCCDARMAARLSSSSSATLWARQLETSAGRLVEAPEEVEQRAFSRARRAHDRDVVALGNIEIDPLQHGHRFLAEEVVLAKVFEPDGRLQREAVRGLAYGLASAGSAVWIIADCVFV